VSDPLRREIPKKAAASLTIGLGALCLFGFIVANVISESTSCDSARSLREILDVILSHSTGVRTSCWESVPR